MQLNAHPVPTQQVSVKIQVQIDNLFKAIRRVLSATMMVNALILLFFNFLRGKGMLTCLRNQGILDSNSEGFTLRISKKWAVSPYSCHYSSPKRWDKKGCRAHYSRLKARKASLGVPGDDLRDAKQAGKNGKGGGTHKNCLNAAVQSSHPTVVPPHLCKQFQMAMVIFLPTGKRVPEQMLKAVLHLQVHKCFSSSYRKPFLIHCC